MEALKWVSSLILIAHPRMRRSRRFGRFKRRGVFLPDMPRRGEAAKRVGAGPMDVVATHVVATAIERFPRKAGAGSLRARRLSAACGRIGGNRREV